MALDPVSEANAAEAIEVPTHLTAAAKFVLSQSTLFELRGSSFKIKCKLCGFEVVTSTHKLLYGHYLRVEKSDIEKCITLDAIKERQPEFYAGLICLCL